MTDKTLIEELKQSLKDNELPGCKDCPHSVGDIYQRDCGFPDCLPISLEDAYVKGRNHEGNLQKAITALEAEQSELEKYKMAEMCYGCFTGDCFHDSVHDCMKDFQPAWAQLQKEVFDLEAKQESAVPEVEEIVRVFEANSMKAETLFKDGHALQRPLGEFNDVVSISAAREILLSLLSPDRDCVMMPVEPTEEFIDDSIDRYFKLEGTTKDHFHVDERTRAVVKQWFKAFVGATNDKQD